MLAQGGVHRGGVAGIDDDRLAVACQHPDVVILEGRDGADDDRTGGHGSIHR